MKTSANRVASRYREALVVPPRRDREYAMYHAFIKILRRDLAKLGKARPVLDRANDYLWGAGLTSASVPTWDSKRLLSDLEGELGGRRDLPEGRRPPEYMQDLQYIRQGVEGALTRALRRAHSFKEWGEELETALSSDEFRENLEFSDLSRSDVRELWELRGVVDKVINSIELMLKRMARVKDPSMSDSVPATAHVGQTETLYHASVSAKQLARDQFSLTMPEDSASAGLGGSQSAGGGSKGISFTEDAYVAKEIARVFREVAMVAQGDVSAREILEWSKRAGILAEVIEWYKDNYAGLDRFKERFVVDGSTFRAERRSVNDEHLADVKAGRAEYDPRISHVWSPIPYSTVFGTPEKVMGLYLSYLTKSGRYDPKFFGVGGPPGLVRRFKSLNPKNIGYVAALVDMTHPNITYGKGEREFRVPPEAVQSVYRFVG